MCIEDNRSDFGPETISPEQCTYYENHAKLCNKTEIIRRSFGFGFDNI